ncbi:DNA topoisomerase 2 [Symbiodinium microadriaticum]|uniref:DNA topoisomerase (ATP-hydrolyzing) n=1 Tax=Symbiodinium microadriaticum TaxID=2951 RepID=A0A1Q9DB05_SYMMI|nr:DNA topoisomerase 2 [Symbiodinium microadriaticum]
MLEFCVEGLYTCTHVERQDAFAALTVDGRAFAWGNADYGGSCGAVSDRLVDIAFLAASDGAFAAVKQDGEVVTWGNSNFGGDSTIQNPDLHGIVSITACGRAFAALRRDGRVFTWGDSTQGGDSSVLAASQVSLLRGSAGAFAALTMEGRVLTWGNHAFGGDCSAVSDQLTEVVDIVASRRAFAALRRDGGVVSWGFAVLGGNSKDVQAELYGIQSLHASSGAFAALRGDGGVIVWGGPSSGGDNSAIRGLFQETDVDDKEWSKAMGKNELAQHLNRSDLGLQKRLFGVPKLEDANLAGTKEGESCTLILTEGDSAKALAVAGLGVVGRDRYGVFPLRGKLRNVRELTVKQMLENKEIEQVLKIMALDASKDEYRDAKGLRYGSIMIMTDQDHDGSHIKGLIINFIQHWFPSLLRLPGFLKEFVTPIVKVQMPLHMISDKLDLKGPVNTLWLKELNAEEKARAQAAQGFDSSFRRGAMEASMAELLVAHQKLESCLFSLGIRNVWDVRWFWRDGNDCLCELESCEGVSRSDIQVLYLTRVARANLAECFGAIHGGITLQFCEGCLLMEITCCREPSETSEDIDSLAAVITACAGCYAKCPPFQRKVCELFRLAVTHFLDLLPFAFADGTEELLNFRSRHYAGGKVYTTWLAKRRECDAEESLPLLPDEGVADAATLVDWRWAEAMSTVGLQQIIQDKAGLEALAFTKQVSLSTSEELELPIPESSLTGIWREFSKRTLSVIEVKRVKSRLAQPSASETVKLQDTSRGALSLSFALDPETPV